MLQTFDFDPAAFDPRTRAAAEADARLFVEFYMHYEKDEDESTKEGRPIFRDVEFMRITTPGDRNNIIERGVTELDKRRFATRYKHWKDSGETTNLVGTPLEQWAWITRAQVQEYAYFGVRSVEQLSEVNDGAVQKVPGMRLMKERAQAWLAATNDTKAAEEIKSELKARDDRIIALEQQVALLLEQNDSPRKRA